MLKGLVLGILLGALFLVGGVYWYFSSGRAPVATSSPPMPFEKKIARIGLHAYLDRLPHPASPVHGDEANLLAGASIYRDQCAVCHGVPGGARTAIAAGMFPKPPDLFRGTGVTDDDEWESYWKIRNGIRLTGMPGYRDSLTETQIWQVCALLKNAHQLPSSAASALSAAGSAR